MQIITEQQLGVVSSNCRKDYRTSWPHDCLLAMNVRPKWKWKWNVNFN